jgi:hypothetical protein
MKLGPKGGINVLDPSTWQQCRMRLQELGGPRELNFPGLSIPSIKKVISAKKSKSKK